MADSNVIQWVQPGTATDDAFTVEEVVAGLRERCERHGSAGSYCKEQGAMTVGDLCPICLGADFILTFHRELRQAKRAEHDLEEARRFQHHALGNWAG